MGLGRSGSLDADISPDPPAPLEEREHAIAGVADDQVLGAAASIKGECRIRIDSARSDRVVVVGSDPRKPEISVRSFDPALTVTRSVWPSKLPTNVGPGSVPTAKGVGFVSLKNPWPTPGSSMTSFDWLLVTSRSG